MSRGLHKISSTMTNQDVTSFYRLKNEVVFGYACSFGVSSFIAVIVSYSCSSVSLKYFESMPNIVIPLILFFVSPVHFFLKVQLIG